MGTSQPHDVAERTCGVMARVVTAQLKALQGCNVVQVSNILADHSPFSSSVMLRIQARRITARAFPCSAAEVPVRHHFFQLVNVALHCVNDLSCSRESADQSAGWG